MLSYADQVAARRAEIAFGPPQRFVAVGTRRGVLPGTIGFIRSDAPVQNVYVRECRGGLIGSVACQQCEVRE